MGESNASFRHEALLYSGEKGFLDVALPFIRDAVAMREPVMVAVSSPRVERLKSELNGEAEYVEFTSIEEIGRNPARLIPAWRAFIDSHAAAGRRIRGIGEPIWNGRSEDELTECHHHESLLNVAFDSGPPLWLVCPYDVTILDEGVVAGAYRTHPVIGGVSKQTYSASYVPPEAGRVPFAGPLHEPADFEEFGFGLEDLHALREWVAGYAQEANFDDVRGSDLVVAANELATNSITHGGGFGLMRIWSENGSVVCEVSDPGQITDRFVGRREPTLDQGSGRGVWIVNQLCDLVQIRSTAAGTIVRTHLSPT